MSHSGTFTISGGTVIDPANARNGRFDIAVRDGLIAAVEPELPASEDTPVFDATGLIVTPGLVDLHVHAYHHATPLGIDPDHYFLGRGVTTAVDTGSAGYDTFPGFRHFIVDRCRTRLAAFLNISRAGLAFAGLGGDGAVPGELDLLSFVDPEGCAACIADNRDVLVGVKIRLSDSIAAGGRNEPEAYRRALAASESAGLPLMVHHNFSTVPLEACPGDMRAGDIYTHCYHCFPGSVVDPDTKEMNPHVLAARERGVLFDIGFGQGSFSWAVGEICAKSGFWPDTISSDLHSASCEGPAYDLPTVMTRVLALGMPLNDVIERATIAPARAVGLDDVAGALSVGAHADIAAFSVSDEPIQLEDCVGELRDINQRLVPAAVWRDGSPGTITMPASLPNLEMAAYRRERWGPRAVVR